MYTLKYLVMYTLKRTCCYIHIKSLLLYTYNEHFMYPQQELVKYINTMNMLCIHYNELVMYIIKYFLLNIYSTSTLNVTL